jgi:glycine/D-amino acid oxidase-like deaminating enzyme
MHSIPQLRLDTLVIGGGMTGLWALDHLLRSGHRTALLESHALGSGETIASQGVIRSGFSGSSHRRGRKDEHRRRWREALAGEKPPALTRTRLRSDYCHLFWPSPRRGLKGVSWRRGRHDRNGSIIPVDERPAILQSCPGRVIRIDEQVIEPTTLVQDLADRNRPALLKIDAGSGLEFDPSPGTGFGVVRLLNPQTGEPLDIACTHLVLAAGCGNDSLRNHLGLGAAQTIGRRDRLYMARGSLTSLNGHAMQPGRETMTITSTWDCGDQVIWQIGGPGIRAFRHLDRPAAHHAVAQRLGTILPGVDLSSMVVRSYDVDRVRRRSWRRLPPSGFLQRSGSVTTIWTPPLALLPAVVDHLVDSLEPPSPGSDEPLPMWPRPDISLPPWESMPW